MKQVVLVLQVVLVFAGAVGGGLIGYVAFFWIAQQGFYGIALPGGLLGLGAGCVACRWRWPAVVCGVLALALSLFTEWKFAPFLKDDSLSYFLWHLHEKATVKLLMIAAGTFIGFWVPFRRVEPDRAASGSNSA